MKIKALAHRGYPSKFPENTMLSYKAAYELGFSHLELDVHLSKDGIPVLMHDITVNRMTNSKGLIKDYTYDELKQLRVGDVETIPTLSQALNYCKNKMNVSVEIKQHGDLYTGIEDVVYETIVNTDMMDQVYVNSFDHFSIVKMRELSKDISLGIIQPGATPAIFPFMKEYDLKYLSVKLEYLTDYYVNMCNDAGIQIVVWPVDNEQQFEFVKRFPNVLSTTNELEEFKRLYEKAYTK